MKSHWVRILCSIVLIVIAASPIVHCGEDGDVLAPIITTMPQQITQKEGSQFQLNCAGKNFDDYALVWKRGIYILSASGLIITTDKRIQVFDNNTLFVKQARLTDSGVYTCTLLEDVTLDHTVSIVSADEASTSGESQGLQGYSRTGVIVVSVSVFFLVVFAVSRRQ